MGLRNKKTSFKKLLIFSLVAVIAVGVFVAAYYGFGTNKVSTELTVDEAQALVDETFAKIPGEYAAGTKAVIDNLNITVKDVKKGIEKNLIFECTYSTYDVNAILGTKLDELFENAYNKYINGKNVNATKVKNFVRDDIKLMFSESNDIITGEITLEAYETNKGEFQLYLDKETVNTCTGGLVSVSEKIINTSTVNYKGEVIDIKNTTTLRTGINYCVELTNYTSEKPDTGTVLQKAVASFKRDFNKNFIEANRWLYLLQGLGTTLGLTGLSALLGIFLGFIVAIIRCTNQTTGKLKFIDGICRLYLTVFRGTPLMVQLLIIYFIILLPIGVPKFAAAVLCFGFNSGAYVAEIVRGGIMSVDQGQMEAGRSLGFNYPQTMINFIIPQAFKAVLPSLANEFITLLKESSVAFYLGVADLTQGGLKIRSQTYSNFMPLIAVALVYLALVLILTYLVGILERRLRKSER